MHSLTLALPTSALLLTVALSGCAAATPASAPISSVVTASPAALSDSAQAALIRDLFRGISADYIARTSPAELADDSVLVVSGSILRVQEGRVEGDPNDDIVDSHSIVVVVRADKPVKGALAQDSAGLVYVELPSSGNRPARDFADALPKGTRVLLYLIAAPDGAELVWGYQDPAAGRPARQPLYMPSNPQSFAIELTDGTGVVWIGESHYAPGAKLADAFPGGKLVPLPD